MEKSDIAGMFSKIVYAMQGASLGERVTLAKEAEELIARGLLIPEGGIPVVLYSFLFDDQPEIRVIGARIFSKSEDPHELAVLAQAIGKEGLPKVREQMEEAAALIRNKFEEKIERFDNAGKMLPAKKSIGMKKGDEQKPKRKRLKKNLKCS